MCSKMDVSQLTSMEPAVAAFHAAVLLMLCWRPTRLLVLCVMAPLVAMMLWERVIPEAMPPGWRLALRAGAQNTLRAIANNFEP